MPLSSSRSSLASDIEAAYKKVKESGAQDGAAPGDIIHQLAVDLHAACESFWLSATVTTEIEIPAGQIDTSGGVTTFPGKGDGDGTLSYPSAGTIVSDIEGAYNDAKAAGEKDGASPESVISTLADGLANAIHIWAELAIVSTDIKVKHVHPTRMNTFGGVYQGPNGTATGVGTIFYPSTPVSNLYGGIEAALNNVKTEGEKDGADPNTIIENLSWELSDAIYLFAVEAEVDTDVTHVGGDTVVGSIVAGATVPGVSTPTTGTGKGRHPANGLS